MPEEVELPDEIKRLMDLQTLDRGLRELEESLNTITGRVNRLREQTAAYEAELACLSREEEEGAAARGKLERELAEGEARLRTRRMRLNMVRNDKELQALGHEVEALKDNNQRIEADLLAMMETAGPRAAKLKELGAALSATGAEAAAAEREVAGRIVELQAELSQRRAARERLAAEISRPLLQRYEMIFTRRQGIAVTLARSGTCQGCMRLLPPQLYNEVQKHLQIHFCPNCLRILYYEG